MDKLEIKEVMSLTEFKIRCKAGTYTDNSAGLFMLVKGAEVSDKHFMPSDLDVMDFPEWATSIAWIDNSA